LRKLFFGALQIFRKNIIIERQLFILSIDITDRKQAEEALQRAHDELEQRVVDRTREMRGALTAAERFRQALDTAVRFLGYRPRSEAEVRERLALPGSEAAGKPKGGARRRM
jgi:PAS domain-containing protein